MTIVELCNPLTTHDVIRGGALEGRAVGDWERLQSITGLQDTIARGGNPACAGIELDPVITPGVMPDTQLKPADDFGLLTRF